MRVTRKMKLNRQKAWRLKVALENGMFDMFHQCPKCNSSNISDYMDADVYKVQKLNQKPHWHYVCFDCGTAETIYYCTTCCEYYGQDNTRLQSPDFDTLDTVNTPIRFVGQVQDLLAHLNKLEFQK
jgi:hypothetical protein